MSTTPTGRRRGWALPLVAAAGLLSLAATPASKSFLPSNFKLEIAGILSGGFKEISGIESEVEVIEFKNGDDPVTRKRPGKVKYGDITIKRDSSKSDDLRSWYEDILAGKTERKSGSVIYLDRAGSEVLRYNFFEAWPCRWKAPELNASGKTTEEIEFCVEKIERK